jgi:putative transposase
LKKIKESGALAPDLQVFKMSNIRRIYIPDGLYFITCITSKRAPILIDNIDLIWRAVEKINSRTNFDLNAWVFLPDHFHIMVNSKTGDISSLLHSIKLSFSMNYRKINPHVDSHIWQKRFWDHVIRDENDYYAHLNYIHINPVKHGLAKKAFDWPHSSIHKFKDYYPNDWGCNEDIKFEGEFGE